jgi:4-carboxymuconolactone decarboxylase
MNALNEVLKERQEQGIKDSIGKTATEPASTDRLKTGEHELYQLDSLQADKLKKAFDDISPELVKFTLEFAYADILSRDNLSKKHRQIATIAALTALGNAQPQLKFHINAGLNIGLTVEEVREIMLLMTIYAGFPSAINVTKILKEVVTERSKGKTTNR